MPEEPAGGADAAWTVPGALDGERVDRALSLITGLSRREVNRLLDDGRVRLAGRPATLRSRKVRSGEKLEIEGSIEPARAAELVPDPTVEFGVVFEDADLVVVDKPAGLVVHPGAGVRSSTLAHGLLARFPDLADLARGAEAERPGIVHRLDKGTSGLLMVARNGAARDSMIGQLASRDASREYLTLVGGAVDADAGLIDGPLGRSDRDPTRIRVQAGGRMARTRYEVITRFAEPAPATLLRCRLETGRTHQIRVHLASIGHPVLGDDRYGVKALGDWRPLPTGRPFLHAAGLSFDHPRSGQRLHFSSPTPRDLEDVLAELSPTQ